MSGDSNVGIKIGREIKAKRIAFGFTVEGLAHELGVNRKAVSRWERGEVETFRPSNVLAIKRVLGIKVSDFVDGSKSLIGSAEVISLNSARDRGMSDEAIFSQIDEMWGAFPLPYALGNDMGSNEKWQSIYETVPDMVHVIIEEDGGVVGYWNVVAIDEVMAERIRNGENINSAITAYDVKPLWAKGVYEMYFVDLLIAKNRRNPAIRRAVQRSFFDFLLRHSDMEIYFSSILANISSVEMRAICSHPGFFKVCDHSCHTRFAADGSTEPTEIFSIDLTSADGWKFLKQDERVQKAYVKKFG